MRRIFITLLIVLGFFTLKAQTVTDSIYGIPVVKPLSFEFSDITYQFYMYNYAVKELDFPDIDNYNKETVLREYREDTKNWYSANPEYNGLFKVLRKKDLDNLKSRYLKRLNEIKADNYPPKPKFVDTGNPRQDEINYKKRMKQWSENHPDYPEYIDTGNPKIDKENYRKARLAFYDKYIKED